MGNLPIDTDCLSHRSVGGKTTRTVKHDPFVLPRFWHLWFEGPFSTHAHQSRNLPVLSAYVQIKWTM